MNGEFILGNLVMYRQGTRIKVTRTEENKV